MHVAGGVQGLMGLIKKIISWHSMNTIQRYHQYDSQKKAILIQLHQLPYQTEQRSAHDAQSCLRVPHPNLER
jgi:hypothetical protein